MPVTAKRLFKKSVVLILLTVTLLIVLKIFFLDVYAIPSDSMRNTFKTNDHILVHKTPYSGPFSGLLYRMNIRAKPAINDIFVFTIHSGIPGYFVKRCVGLPGSEIVVKRGTVFIDGKAMVEPSSVRHYYKIWINDHRANKKDLEQATIDALENGYRKQPGYIIIALDNHQKSQLKNGIDSIRVLSAADTLEVKVPETKDNILNTVPLRIPFKGMKVALNDETFKSYEHIIRNFEAPDFRRQNNNYYISDQEIYTYTFREDYFFMMGDNRDIAIDSRHYGLIPGKNLVGQYLFQW